ncbi:uncharacterized protein LOC132614739 isoform X2 [Lycium barbarum]|uniref:uncharacterized protein LOC132614739 isoform X2 n=1 Tax=Lycium barbarum TaxID=112863 RepID=UPI00293F4295|nr:uncharacterized protein LOC132614739 isoform X2 [Lycium barbarum]
MMTNVLISDSTGPTDVISHPQSGKKRKGRGKTTGLSIQKKRKYSDNGKLEVIIPPDRTIAVGPGANDFVTELSVKVFQHARHDVKNWKNVSNLAKDRIIAHMLDTFQLPDTQHIRDTILERANHLYRYRRKRLHDHFKKFATEEERLQNKPKEVNEVEWKFLVEYFNSEDFKRDINTGKEPNLQKLWELTHTKNGRWVNDASAELNDKLKEIVAEQIQDVEEDTDVDPIINAAFVRIMGETSGYCRGQGSGIKRTGKRYMNGVLEQLQAQRKEVEEERCKRESVECKLTEVKNQLEEERKNREVMEARLVRDQKMLKGGIMALVSHLQSSKNGLPSAILNIIADSSDSDAASPTSLMDDISGERA